MVRKRRPRPLLLSLALLASLAARPASADSSNQELPYARLTAPAGGVELTPGTVVEIAWEGLALPPRAHEWEAFLSVDGGRTYPLRITPHLDLAIRRFAFRVPHLPTREACLMLRFGDEKREVGQEMPQRFAISAGRGLWAPPPQRSFLRGEKARRGDRGVVLWTEGSMDGRSVREVAASGVVLGLTGIRPFPVPLLPLLWPSPGRQALPPPAVTEAAFSAAPAPAVPDSTPPLAPVEVRLLIRRFNE